MGFLAYYVIMRLKTLSHIVESPSSVAVAACVIWPYSVIGCWYTNGFYYSEDFMWQNIVTIITMLSSCVAVKINYILTALVIFPIGDIYVMISGIVYILRLQSIDSIIRVTCNLCFYGLMTYMVPKLAILARLCYDWICWPD